jgi:antagonist of KipI
MAAIDSLNILSPGLQTTVQDLGRLGYGRFGVAPSGALDSFAMRTANLLVGNPEDAAGLETLLMGLRIQAMADMTIAITGGDLQPRIEKRPLPMWRSHEFKKGETLSFLAPASGCRAYVAFGGGIQVPGVMRSAATNLPSAFGGFEGRALQAGDVLKVNTAPISPSSAGRALNPDLVPVYADKWTLRVIWGPQDKDFPKAARDEFVKSSYAVSPKSDRTGIRLDGPSIEKKDDIPGSIISEGVISGSIQIPGDGKPIIILGETVSGGYRKIATVISADLSLLGQIKPGDRVNFTPSATQDADAALQAMEDKIAAIRKISGS